MDLSIGMLAKLGGVNIDTVRYYQRNRLLAPNPLPAGAIMSRSRACVGMPELSSAFS